MNTLSAFQFALMSQNLVMNHPKEESQMTLTLRAFRHYSIITSRVLAATVGTVVIMGVPAYFFDKYFGTWPIVFGLALIASLPISQLLVLRSMRDFIKNNPQ